MFKKIKQLFSIFAIVYLVAFTVPANAAITVDYVPMWLIQRISTPTPPTCIASGHNCTNYAMVLNVAEAFIATVQIGLRASAVELETATVALFTATMLSLKLDIDGIERSLASKWRTDWFNVVLPGLKNMVSQITVNNIEETRQVQSFQDARAVNEVLRRQDLLEIESEEENRPSIHANVAATAAGGYGRAVAFSRAMRIAVPKELINTGINKKGKDKNISKIAYNKYRYDNYKKIFCNPDAEGGAIADECEASEETFYNADVEPNKFLYSRLTLPVDPDADPDGKMFETLIAMRLNLFGSPANDTMPVDTLNSTDGRKKFFDRRSYLSRYGAVMSVHNLIESWRMPGSDMGDWMESILERTAVQDDTSNWYSNITNPSYRELIHAMTVERFNSGHYARDLISTETDVKMEKISLTALQLMQLRDYYELLERTALVLAVQVSLMTDDANFGSGVENLPTSDGGE